MRRAFATGLLSALLAALGCGGEKGNDGLAPVGGTVTVDGAPAGGAAVAFVPQDGTPGNGGHGAADATGRYEITTPQGKKGLAQGQYKVTVSYRRNADGTAPDPNVPPIESRALELMPPKYSDRDKTELTATVTAEVKPHDFTLLTGKKK